ncbi:24458_t:CDS:2 [Dentiscutata erythropus]|uniref:24458_t:CDS:1 n=1 Tax=Dentiscutata erythropus TaxID=1348616 RepID=A0A9N9ITR4_9GLOM|nr:24458_t:CDS:2 [Dentiscutata erythropus]
MIIDLFILPFYPLKRHCHPACNSVKRVLSVCEVRVHNTCEQPFGLDYSSSSNPPSPPPTNPPLSPTTTPSSSLPSQCNPQCAGGYNCNSAGICAQCNLDDDCGFLQRCNKCLCIYSCVGVYVNVSCSC